ncbi:hypothetical protein [Nonomuraea maheshkhaliensis]|uniref:hypothetical protein n=1 Tax=Nonomuraea maheshkhaliensis TaxID=419590 RepID=UPI0031FA3550
MATMFLSSACASPSRCWAARCDITDWIEPGETAAIRPAGPKSLRLRNFGSLATSHSGMSLSEQTIFQETPASQPMRRGRSR